MKQEYVITTVIGLLVLGYVLDAVVNPLTLALPTPYHFFIPELLTKYTFTTTSVVIKSIALFLTPIWALSFAPLNGLTKGSILLVLSALLQLYALQDIATNAQVVPIEWSLSFTLTGMLLLIPAVLYMLIGTTSKIHKTITKDEYSDATKSKNEGESEL